MPTEPKCSWIKLISFQNIMFYWDIWSRSNLSEKLLVALLKHQKLIICLCKCKSFNLLLKNTTWSKFYRMKILQFGFTSNLNHEFALQAMFELSLVRSSLNTCFKLIRTRKAIKSNESYGDEWKSLYMIHLKAVSRKIPKMSK